MVLSLWPYPDYERICKPKVSSLILIRLFQLHMRLARIVRSIHI